MNPAPLREIPRQPASNPNSQPRRLLVRAMSPDQQALGFTDDLGDPAGESITWSPLTWVANKASAAADLLKTAGATIYDAVLAETKDVLGTLNAAFTGQPPAEPGPVFNLATGVASSFNRILPQAVQEKLGTLSKDNIAGYITLSDGTKIPVPKAQDNTAQGEKGLSDTLKAATTKANLEAATARAKLALETQKENATETQWQQAFELKTRQAATQERLFDLQARAMTLALDRETTSSAQRALWGYPSTLSPEMTEATRVIRAIGPGVAGAIKISKSLWSTE
jgi:hypothetical protein